MSYESRADEALHRALQAAVIAERIEVMISYEHLNRKGSPLFDPWDNLAPLIVVMVLALLVLLNKGMLIGMMAMLAGILAHLLAIRYWIAHRLYRRMIRVGLYSAPNFKAVWRHGGLGLRLRESGEICLAPEGDWRKFVRRHLAPALEDATLGFGL